MKHWLIIGILAAFAVSGCGKAKSNSKSMPAGIPIVERVLKAVHNSTGWLLGKDDVSVEAMNLTKTGSGYVTDMKIVVIKGDNQFTTVAKEVSCDKNRIPTAKSVEEINAAVEQIKDKIARFQD